MKNTKITLFLVVAALFLSSQALIFADDTIGGAVYASKTTAVTTKATAVAIFAASGGCTSVLVQALATNTMNAIIVVDLNDTPTDGHPFTLAAREIIKFPLINRDDLFVHVETGTEGVTAFCTLP